jgi:hypothetical protein
MKLRKEKSFFLGYDKKTALTAAIILSFILALYSALIVNLCSIDRQQYGYRCL